MPAKFTECRITKILILPFSIIMILTLPHCYIGSWVFQHLIICVYYLREMPKVMVLSLYVCLFCLCVCVCKCVCECVYADVCMCVCVGVVEGD